MTAGGDHSLTRRELVRRGTGAAATLAFPWIRRLPRAASERPNLVVITSDQHHWEGLGRVDPFFETPSLDGLAEEALAITNAFCPSPQCSPSRAALMTGFHPHRTGVVTNLGPKDEVLHLPTVGVGLREAGYRTAYFGKWHLGRVAPELFGFDEFAHSGLDEVLTGQGRTFLRSVRRSEAPFALFLMYVEPHGIQRVRLKPKRSDEEAPLDVTWTDEDFDDKPAVHRWFAETYRGRNLIGRSRESWESFRLEYRDRVRGMDAEVGSILKLLKKLELWENTAVLFTSDHGEMDTHHRLIFKGPLMYEHLVRVPMLFRLPEALGGAGAGATSDHYAWSHIDLAPTLLDLAGAPAETDGRSIVPLLKGDGLEAREFVISQFDRKGKWRCPVRMLRTPDFKYVRYIEHGEELYDLQRDPVELVNRVADPEYADRKRELGAALDTWIEENEDPFPTLTASPREELRVEEGEDD